MKNTKQILAVAVLAVLLVVAVVTGTKKVETTPQTAPQSSNSQKEPVAIPDFNFTDSDGNPVAFSDFAGKPAVINFWATWCPYCVKELPDFDKAMGEFKDKVNFIFLDVADGRQETVSGAKAFLEKQNYENIYSYFDTGLEGVTLFGLNSFPTTVYVDKDGNLYTACIGMTNYDSIVSVLAAMCEE